MIKAAILLGGQGKRLRPLTIDTPKALLKVGGKPIIDWQIEWLRSFGIDSFVVLTGYLKDKMIEHFESQGNFNSEVAFSIEETPLGTGGALRNAAKHLADESKFVVVNGDVITNLDLKKLTLDSGNIATISLTPLRSTYGVVNVEGTKVTGFEEKPLIKNYWLNAGVYLMSNKILSMLPERGDVEKTTFPELAKKGLLQALKFDNAYWRSVDSVKDVDEVGDDLTKKGIYRK